MALGTAWTDMPFGNESITLVALDASRSVWVIAPLATYPGRPRTNSSLS